MMLPDNFYSKQKFVYEQTKQKKYNLVDGLWPVFKSKKIKL